MKRKPELHPDDAATVIRLVRENLRLLSDLVSRYEIARQDNVPDDRIVRSPAHVAALFQDELADMAQEQLRVALLDVKNRVLGASLVYQGGLNTIVVRLGECFREAVRVGATAIILVHNHPSGDPTPSPEDIRVTQEAGQAGRLLDIDLLDHIVIGRQGRYVSLRERGFYRPPTPNRPHDETDRCSCIYGTRNKGGRPDA